MTDAPQCGRMQRDMNRMNEKAPEFPDIRVDNAIEMPPRVVRSILLRRLEV